MYAACRPFHVVSQGANQDETKEVTIDGEHTLADTVLQRHPCQYLKACKPQMNECKTEMHRSHAVVLLRMQQRDVLMSIVAGAAPSCMELDTSSVTRLTASVL